MCVPRGKPIAQIIISHVALPDIKIVSDFSKEIDFSTEDHTRYKMVWTGGFGSSDVVTTPAATLAN